MSCFGSLLQILAEELPNLLACIHVGTEPVVACPDYLIEPHIIVCLVIHVAVVHNHVPFFSKDFPLTVSVGRATQPFFSTI